MGVASVLATEAKLYLICYIFTGNMIEVNRYFLAKTKFIGRPGPMRYRNSEKQAKGQKMKMCFFMTFF